MTPPRIVLAGNNRASEMVLDLVLEDLPVDHVLCIAGPGSPTVAAWASRGVRIIEPDDVNHVDVVEEVGAFGPSLLLSVYYTQLFRRPILEVVDGPVVNFHPSLLPLHRGVAPLIWTIVEGDQRTGVTAHLIDEGIDTGGILVQRVLPIHRDDTGASLHLKAAHLVSAVAAELWRGWFDHGVLPEPQPQSGVPTSHSYRDPRVNHLRWTDPSERIRNIVRALAPPHPGAYAEIDGTRIVFGRVEHTGADGHRSRPPGSVVLNAGDRPLIATGDGFVRVEGFSTEATGTRPGSDLRLVPGISEGVVLR